MIRSTSVLFVFLSVTLFYSCSSTSVFIDKLTCEYLSDPMGLDVTAPRMSWQIVSSERGQKQSAYRIIVASSSKKLKSNKGDLWDSGKVPSGQSVQVPYAGKKLDSRTQCFWKIMVWDKDDQPSKWSTPAFWTMGLLEEEDWTAKWIGSPDTVQCPYYRHSFTIKEIPDRTTIYVAALGYYELYVNGRKVGDEVLAPAVSNFSKRSYYQTYDLSELLKEGENYVGIHMGSGWYSGVLPGVKHHGPVVRAQLEMNGQNGDQMIMTDLDWQTKQSSRIILGNWRHANFGGEEVDARKKEENWWNDAQSTSGWNRVVEVEVADVPCSAQPCRGNTVFKIIDPQTIEWLDEETVLVDFGTNLTGMYQMNFHDLTNDQEITLYYADFDGRREEDQWRVRNPKKGFAYYNQYDRYISAGDKVATFENKFNYHGFRYVLIEGISYLPDASDLKALAIETATEKMGSFSCSNDLYNRIDDMVRWTYRCLSLGGQTVDCPHRERLGYGDGQTIMDLGCYNYDVASLYAKWSQNWWDEQDVDGFVPFTAPCPHRTGGGPAWGAMCIMVPWKTYQFYDDLRLLEKGYPYMKKYIEYLESYCKDDVLQDIFPGEKWPNLGDWVPPRRGMDKRDWVEDRSRRFFNNCYRVYLLQIMQKVAVLTGNDTDVRHFREQEKNAKVRIHETWFNKDDMTYANGEQPYLIFPLMTEITPDSLQDAVFEKYVEALLEKNDGHLNTGMIGTQIMTDYLVELDRNDLVDMYVNKTTYPGWGYMVEDGATTCWEQWNGFFSQIHSCFPYIGGWFYKGLAGIRLDPEAPGFKNIIMKPSVVKSVEWVKCSFESNYGQIVSNWNIENDTFHWEIEVPPNSTATVHIPGEYFTEGGADISEVTGVCFLRQEEGVGIFKVESGRYDFTGKMHI